MDGIWGVLGILGLFLISFLLGKKRGSDDTKLKMEGQVAVEQKKVEKAEAEKENVVQAAQVVKQSTAEQDAIHQYFEEFHRDYVEAEEHEDIDAEIEAARKLAERAVNWQKRNNQ